MEALINTLAGAYLGALETGARALAVYAIPLLGVAAFVQFHREWWPVVLHGGSQLGEALGHFLFLLITVGFYMWFLVHLWDIANAALDTFVQWGTLGGGNGLPPGAVRNPGFIMTMGMKLAFPFMEQGTWFQQIWQGLKLSVSPVEFIMTGCILIAFTGVCVHHLFMLVEFYLALMCGQVLIGLGIWRTTAHFGEFALGWITGSLVRALVSCTMIGISIPLFELIRNVPGAGSFIVGGRVAEGFPEISTYAQNIIPVVGSLIFAVLAWVLPARAARMASGATLGLTGSTITSAAMGAARFGMMATGAGRAAAGAVRGASKLVQKTTQ